MINGLELFAYILVITALGSALLFFLPVKAKPAATIGLIVPSAVYSVYLSITTLLSLGEYSLFRWSIFGIGNGTMSLDSLSAVFLFIISFTAIPVAVYASGYLKKYLTAENSTKLSIHFISLVLLYVSMCFIVVCRDWYGFLFSWELMTVTSFILMAFEGEKRDVRRAAVNYLVIMHIGFVLILGAFIMLSARGLYPSFDSLGDYFSRGLNLPVYLLFLTGFGMKAGLFPLHLWLPEAHPAAPAHISAFMSGVMIKMGVYGIMRVTLSVGPGAETAGIILLSAGAVTGLWGAIMAAVQNEMKKLLAYSSMENVGIIIAALGLAVLGRSYGNNVLALCSLTGALLHTVNHSMFKSLLFFTAGNVYGSTHTTSFDKLGGVSRKMPYTAMIALIGAGAISALPPFNGFVSEFIIYSGMFSTLVGSYKGVIPSVCGITALALIGGVVLLAFTKFYSVVFLGHVRDKHYEPCGEADKKCLYAAILPVGGIMLIGLLPYLVIDELVLVSSGIMDIVAEGDIIAGFSSTALSITGVALFITVLCTVLYGLRRYILRNRKQDHSPVWGCGFGHPTSRMQYSGESFSEGLYGISNSLMKNEQTGEDVAKYEIFPHKHSFNIRRKDKVSTVLTKQWLEVVSWVNSRVMRLNTGKVNHYIMYSLLFLTIVLVLSIFKLL